MAKHKAHIRQIGDKYCIILVMNAPDNTSVVDCMTTIDIEMPPVEKLGHIKRLDGLCLEIIRAELGIDDEWNNYIAGLWAIFYSHRNSLLSYTDDFANYDLTSLSKAVADLIKVSKQADDCIFENMIAMEFRQINRNLKRQNVVLQFNKSIRACQIITLPEEV